MRKNWKLFTLKVITKTQFLWLFQYSDCSNVILVSIKIMINSYSHTKWEINPAYQYYFNILITEIWSFYLSKVQYNLISEKVRNNLIYWGCFNILIAEMWYCHLPILQYKISQKSYILIPSISTVSRASWSHFIERLVAFNSLVHQGN